MKSEGIPSPAVGRQIDFFKPFAFMSLRWQSVIGWIYFVVPVMIWTACEPLGTTIHPSAPHYDARAAVATAIRQENAKPGSTEWVLTDVSLEHEIEGYASAASVNRGEDIQIFVNTAEPSYLIEIFRMGWYGGAGGRRVMEPTIRAGKVQPKPQFDPHTRLVECDWKDPFVLHIPHSSDPTDWSSGIYLAKLTGLSSGKQSYVVFVVRDDARASDLLFQSSVTTFQAYNEWGGFSLYSKPRAYQISFDRPYGQKRGSAGEFLGIRHFEYNMLRFLEREGYDVTYTTDVDTHARGELLLNHKAFLSVGHDEYWSWQMRDHVESARDQGVSLGFFGANVSYFQIRLEPSRITGAPDRTIVCYKSWSLDPMSRSSDPELARRTTILFRNFRVRRPEDAMVGVMYYHSPVHGDVVVEDASHWAFEGTGLHNGDHIQGLLGYEADRVYGNAPQGTQRIAHSPYRSRGTAAYSDMTVWSASNAPTVFATGSMNWNLGLDEYRAPDEPEHVPVSPAAQQITRNVLHRFGADPKPD